MKSSYKIALLVATVLCIYVVWYYSSLSKPNEAAARIEQQPDTALIEPPPEEIVLDEPLPTPIVRPAPKVPTIDLNGAPPIQTKLPKPNAGATSQTYTVKAGDSLASIAVAIYGSESYWDEIAKANPRVDPARLRVGQTLKLPDKAALDRGESSTDPAAAAPGDTITYIVKDGDTLSGIATAYGSDWQYIYNVNKSVIGANPNNLKAGMKLKIPPTPRAAE